MPQRRPNGLSNALKWAGLAILAIFVATTIANLFSNTDDTGIQGRQNTQYQNEDYQVPPVDQNPKALPEPDNYTQATQWMEQNSFYDVTVARPVRCEVAAIDLASASNSQLEQHLNDYLSCLMRVWGPALESAGYVAVRPSVTVYDTTIRTRCGKMPKMNAAYCSADQQVYYASDLPRIIPSQLKNTPFIVESVLAHEFSHAIQGRTGILYSEAAWQQNSDQVTADNFSRRTEVQADCWAGMFNASVAQSLNISEEDQQQISTLFFSIGDDQLTGDPSIAGNHGHGDTRQSWYLTGVSNTLAGACNTYVVPDDQVK